MNGSVAADPYVATTPSHRIVDVGGSTSTSTIKISTGGTVWMCQARFTLSQPPVPLPLYMFLPHSFRACMFMQGSQLSGAVQRAHGCIFRSRDGRPLLGSLPRGFRKDSFQGQPDSQKRLRWAPTILKFGRFQRLFQAVDAVRVVFTP